LATWQDVAIGIASLIGGLVVLTGTGRIAILAVRTWGGGKRPFKLLRVLFGCLVGVIIGAFLLALAAGSFFPSIR
jgi:hypothetical protein